MNNLSRRMNALNAGSLLSTVLASKAPKEVSGLHQKPRGREPKAHGRLSEQA